MLPAVVREWQVAEGDKEAESQYFDRWAEHAPEPPAHVKPQAGG